MFWKYKHFYYKKFHVFFFIVLWKKVYFNAFLLGYNFKYNFISYDYLQYSIFIFCWIKVVNKQTSWSSANSTCELAGFRLSGPVSPEQIPVDSALPEQSFWIGALSHHTPWFQVYSKLVFISIHVIDSVFLLSFFFFWGGGLLYTYRLIHLNNY